MSPTAQRSRWPVRLLLFAGVVLVLTMTLRSLPTARHDSVPFGGAVRADAALAYSHWFEFGRASWYGRGLQGQTTASGQAFDMHAMTCAHPTLPLGALIRVTNLRNHRSVVVQVNDRGPAVPGRVVDLSYAAAQILGFRGVSRVRLDMVDPSPTPAEVARITWPEMKHH